MSEWVDACVAIDRVLDPHLADETDRTSKVVKDIAHALFDTGLAVWPSELAAERARTEALRFALTELLEWADDQPEKARRDDIGLFIGARQALASAKAPAESTGQ